MKENNFNIKDYQLHSNIGELTLEIYHTTNSNVKKILKYVKDTRTCYSDKYKDNKHCDFIITDKKKEIISLAYILLKENLIYTSLENTLRLFKMYNELKEE